MSGPVPRVVQALFAGAFDYAGLFPPASVDLETAARNYGAYRRGPFAWILGRLVLPAARLDEFPAAAAPGLPSGPGALPWRLAVVLGQDASADFARVDAFDGVARTADACVAIADTVEARVQSVDDIEALARHVPPGTVAACEIPLSEGRSALVRRARAHGFTAKVRAGGVVADAFPSSASLAEFLLDATSCSARLKATAGLHHALRGEYRMTYEPGAASTTMHGFLNLFMAVAACRQGWRDVREIVDILERRNADDLRVSDDVIRWRDLSVTTAEADDVREHVGVTIGTCSFEEPVSELKALGILPS